MLVEPQRHLPAGALADLGEHGVAQLAEAGGTEPGRTVGQQRRHRDGRQAPAGSTWSTTAFRKNGTEMLTSLAATSSASATTICARNPKSSRGQRCGRINASSSLGLWPSAKLDCIPIRARFK